jgi:hypothetical protein
MIFCSGDVFPLQYNFTQKGPRQPIQISAVFYRYSIGILSQSDRVVISENSVDLPIDHIFFIIKTSVRNIQTRHDIDVAFLFAEKAKNIILQVCKVRQSR